MATTQSLKKVETLQKVVDFLSDWQDRTKRDPAVNTLFDLLAEGKITAAKSTLEKIMRTSDSSMRRRGYVNALNGMIVAFEMKGGRNLFINKLMVRRGKELKQKFLQQSRNKRQTDFDQGYFSAWTDYLERLEGINSA